MNPVQSVWLRRCSGWLGGLHGRSSRRVFLSGLSSRCGGGGGLLPELCEGEDGDRTGEPNIS